MANTSAWQLVSKGEDGYLASDIGYIRGEMIERFKED